ncbi:transcription antitermination factor NusB [Candidatus Shapirobacteria bacterium CG07_land_8_20_14_0_80_39_18]|uniref:Transcription antitermination protein NusB n=1 Tax=Candidatus Shapirobacteria bacterium CG07_land_8_20_14_0_80_39_18 TaxID=1974882 RepID=A0A2M6YR82_9BACT|nr:MAG: transcription antitermination factor NusB [Candidatus Shapirobacteria bacterium CG07_land_8_20_14_0_80_39_18]
MKTKSDPRHQKRRETIKSLFSYSFYKKQVLDEVAKKVLKETEFLDKQITLSAPEWPLSRINKIDLAILRLAAYELLIKKVEPPKVIIDEAVELAKEFGSENSASFVNGVLGNILKKTENESTN